eukprot:6211866-Pleurochrysis_carterae.AAC.1
MKPSKATLPELPSLYSSCPERAPPPPRPCSSANNRARRDRARLHQLGVRMPVPRRQRRAHQLLSSRRARLTQER